MENYNAEKELKLYAEEMSNTIVIRTYENGNSRDLERQATEDERKIISSIIYGALLAIRCGRDASGVVTAAEFIGDLQIQEMNGYDTIYQRILSFIWE